MSFQDLLPGVSDEEVQSILMGMDFLARKAISETLKKSFVISFSGGIDSSILAVLCREVVHAPNIPLLIVGREGSRDASALKNLESKIDLSNFKIISKTLDRESIESATLRVSRVVEVRNLSHLEDSVAFWLIANEMRSFEGAKFLVSANGPDELFCGYDRFRRILDSRGYTAVREEIASSLESANELRQQVRAVLSEFGFESREPFLDRAFVEHCFSNVPIEMKILAGDDRLRKRIWRAYGRRLGLADDIVLKPKRAMQFSMGIHLTVLSLLKSGRISLSK